MRDAPMLNAMNIIICNKNLPAPRLWREKGIAAPDDRVMTIGPTHAA